MNNYYLASLIILAKKAKIEVVLKRESENYFNKKYTNIKGKKPNKKMYSLLSHEANKWGNQLRVICKQIDETELEVVKRGLSIYHIYPNPGGGYRFGTNSLVWELLQIGFDLGQSQNYQGILKIVLNRYK